MNHDEVLLNLLQKLGSPKLLDRAVTFPVPENTEVETDDDSGDENRVKVPEERAPSGLVTASNFFRHPDSHPILLDLALIHKYGIEWMDWEQEVLEVRIPEDFDTPTVSDLNISKIQAVRTLHMVDTFWQHWEIFLWCCMSLNGIFPDFEVMQVPSVGQCMIAADIAGRIRSDIAWSDEVKQYLGIVHRHDGIFCPIPPLDFVTLDTEGFPLDCEEIKEQWPQVRDSRRAPSEESVTAEQLRRMLEVYEYLFESQTELSIQLPLLKNVQD